MGFLTKIYRDNFVPLAKRLLLELLEEEPTSRVGLVFHEAGLPHGTETVLSLRSNDDETAVARIAERSLRGNESPKTQEKEVSSSKIEELLSELESLNIPPLTNFSGQRKDGVVFLLSWGRHDNIFSLSIKNPEPNTAHYQIVERLRKFRASIY